MSDFHGIPLEWLSDDFREAYGLLCDAVYFGVGGREDAGRITGSTGGTGIHFADEDLLWFKAEVDRWIAAESAAVRSWAKARARARTGGEGSTDRHRGDLAEARDSWHHAAELDEEA